MSMRFVAVPEENVPSVSLLWLILTSKPLVGEGKERSLPRTRGQEGEGQDMPVDSIQCTKREANWTHGKKPRPN